MKKLAGTSVAVAVAVLGMGIAQQSTAGAATPTAVAASFQLPAAGARANGYIAYVLHPVNADDKNARLIVRDAAGNTTTVGTITSPDEQVVALSGDARYVLTTNIAAGTSRVWDVASRRVAYTWNFSAQDAHFVPDGVYVSDFSGGPAKVVRLTGATVRNLPTSHVFGSVVSPLGTLVMQNVTSTNSSYVVVRRTTAGSPVVKSVPRPAGFTDCSAAHGYGPNSFVMDCVNSNSTNFFASFRAFEVNYDSGVATALSPVSGGISDVWATGATRVGQDLPQDCGGYLHKVTSNTSQPITLPDSKGFAPDVIGSNGSNLYYIQPSSCQSPVNSSALRSYNPNTGAMATLAGSTTVGRGTVTSAVLVSPSE